jgi:hypothetical protein
MVKGGTTTVKPRKNSPVLREQDENLDTFSDRIIAEADDSMKSTGASISITDTSVNSYYCSCVRL